MVVLVFQRQVQIDKLWYLTVLHSQWNTFSKLVTHLELKLSILLTQVLVLVNPDITNASGKLTLTANASGSGVVDMFLQGQNGGDVYPVGQSGDALLQGEDDTDLTVVRGDSSTGDAGDLVLKGGNGGANGVSGHAVIKGGNGGATDGHVEIRGADDTEIMLFKETASAADYFEATNGTGGVELSAKGDSTDVNITFAPKGDGIILAPTYTICQVHLITHLQLKNTLMTRRHLLLTLVFVEYLLRQMVHHHLQSVL